MPVELEATFVGLWLDEELLREEFDAIIGANWPTSPDQPERCWPRRELPPVGEAERRTVGHPGRLNAATMSTDASDDIARFRERGPPMIGSPSWTSSHPEALSTNAHVDTSHR